MVNSHNIYDKSRLHLSVLHEQTACLSMYALQLDICVPAMQAAQRSTVQRFSELQSGNAELQQQVRQAQQQLAHIAEEKAAAAMYEKKRIAERLQRRPQRNRAFKVIRDC